MVRGYHEKRDPTELQIAAVGSVLVGLVVRGGPMTWAGPCGCQMDTWIDETGEKKRSNAGRAADPHEV